MVIAPRKLARLKSQDYMFVVGEWGCRIHDPMDYGSPYHSNTYCYASNSNTGKTIYDATQASVQVTVQLSFKPTIDNSEIFAERHTCCTIICRFLVCSAIKPFVKIISQNL